MRRIILYICGLVLLLLPVSAYPSVSSVYSEISPNPVILGQSFTIKATVLYNDNGTTYTMPDSPTDYVEIMIGDIYGYGYVYTHNGVAKQEISYYPLSRFPVGSYPIKVRVYHDGKLVGIDDSSLYLQVISIPQNGIPSIHSTAPSIPVILGQPFEITTNILYNDNGTTYVMPDSSTDYVEYTVVNTGYVYGPVYSHHGTATEKISNYPLSRFPVGINPIKVRAYHDGKVIGNNETLYLQVIPNQNIHTEISPNPVILGQPFTIKATVLYNDNGTTYTMPDSPTDYVDIMIGDVYGYGYVYTHNGVAKQEISYYPLSRFPVGSYPIKVRVYHDGKLVGIDDSSLYLQVISIPQSNNIPEFPTVAAPIVAILGLVLVIDYRKK